MMSEKRFIVETVEIIDVDTDEIRISEVITDIVENCSYETFEDVCDMLNSQHIYVKVLADENEQLREQLLNALSYVPMETRINLLGSLKRE